GAAHIAPQRDLEPVAAPADQWGAPEALVQEFREPAPIVSAPISEPVHIPGSILDLRTPIAHPHTPVAPPTKIIVEPEPEAYVEPEPEPATFVEPELEAYVEPEPMFVEPQPETHVEPVTYALVEPVTVPAPEPVQVPAAPAPTTTGSSASFEAAL